MNNLKPGRRLWHWIYYVAGSAAGLYVIYLLVVRFGSMASREHILQAVPVSLMVIAWFVIPAMAATQSWRLLFPSREAPALRWSGVLTWIGLSVNWLLPVALVGGELVKLRLALSRVPRSEDLVASLVGDKTIQVATQLLYTLVGLAILAWASDEVTGGLREAAGFVLFCAAVYLFYRLQRGGLFARAATPLKRFVRDRAHFQGKAARIDAAVEEMYRRRRRWWLAVGWRMAFRLLLAGEVVLVFWWLEQPIAIGTVVALESVAQASRVAAIFIPAALGVQEAMIMAVGLLLGCAPEPLIILAVVKRIRELLVGGAGLVAWQLQEARSIPRGEA